MHGENMISTSPEPYFIDQCATALASPAKPVCMTSASLSRSFPWRSTGIIGLITPPGRHRRPASSLSGISAHAREELSASFARMPNTTVLDFDGERQ